MGFNLVLDGSQLSILFVVQHHRKISKWIPEIFFASRNKYCSSQLELGKSDMMLMLLVYSHLTSSGDLIVRSEAGRFPCALFLSIKVFNFFFCLFLGWLILQAIAYPYPFLFFSGIISSQYVDVPLNIRINFSCFQICVLFIQGTTWAKLFEKLLKP